MDSLLTIREAAEYAKASQRTIRRWIAQGDLPAARVGPKFVRIRQSELEQMTRDIPSARS